MPTPIHDCISSIFNSKICSVQEALPNQIRQKIRTTLSEEFSGFGGRWEGSSKVPDLAIKVEKDTGGYEWKWILEVGFSESYEELCEDAKLWLEGNLDILTVCLVKFTEDPLYQCPISSDDLGQIPSKADKVDSGDVILQGEHGPAFYRGHRWVGQISAFMETWSRGEDGIARKSDYRRNLLTPNNPWIQIQLGDFLDIPLSHNGIVHVSLEDFRRRLPNEIKALATSRCHKMLRKHKGDGQADQEYQP
jgi:hypothetical protein